MANIEEIAWLAGLIEGDGSLQLHKNSKDTKIPLIAVTMLDKDIIERVAKILKCNIGTYPTPKKDKMVFTARSGKRSVVEPLIISIYPYMGFRRKEQINKMLNWYKEHPLKDKVGVPRPT